LTCISRCRRRSPTRQPIANQPTGNLRVRQHPEPLRQNKHLSGSGRSGGLVMLEWIGRIVVRMFAAVGLGALTGALYAGLIDAVYLHVITRWDRVFVFSLTCVLIGALLGLLRGIERSLSIRSTAASSPAPIAGRVHVTPGNQRGTPSSQAPLGVAARQSDSVQPGQGDALGELCRDRFDLTKYPQTSLVSTAAVGGCADQHWHQRHRLLRQQPGKALGSSAQSDPGLRAKVPSFLEFPS
jgi:hypothetical protein